MDDSPVGEYRNKMLDWGLPLSQYSQQCQACFAPQSGSELDIVENAEQGRQANQRRYPRSERRYSVFRNHGTVAPEYSGPDKMLCPCIYRISRNRSGSRHRRSYNDMALFPGGTFPWLNLSLIILAITFCFRP